MKIPVIGIAILLLAAVCQNSMAADKKTYIVRVAKFEEIQETLNVEEARYFESSLESVSNTAKMFYTYKNVLNGYSVSLTLDEADALKDLPQVLSVSSDTVYHLQTTRTPAFLGLDQPNADLPSPQQVSDIIIGVIDTGVWPESKSYNDKGLGPIPSHWKGECVPGMNFTKSMCNKKLVGARYFSHGYERYYPGRIDWNVDYNSSRDIDGHGTHTSTTAAGSTVLNANESGYASGTARGMATQARIAIYKCCWKGHCVLTDILAAMDKAIDDNVDVISLSIGGGMDLDPYYEDMIAIGAFAAMEKGILVSCVAGNDGPTISSIANVAPWITTVGAGTLDRDFPAPVILGNGNIYFGISLYNGKSLDGKFLPVVYAGNATNDTTYGHFCLPGTLNPDKVRGKLVLCDRGLNARIEKGFVVKAAGGVGMILANTESNGEELEADAHLYLATAVGLKAGKTMKEYLSSDHNPTATIQFQGTKLGIQAPMVAKFSSRGPNLLTPDILKPDLIAPGVKILAGWTGAVSPTGQKDDHRRVQFNIISGTSLSCPHVSGLAALVKAAHPNWSPAAIRSALMTTAYSTYKNGKPMIDLATGKPSTPFDHGAGHVNPVAALDPGLVYDLNATDYFNFLCALNYTKAQINTISKNTNFACEINKNSYSVSALNYPSFAVTVAVNQEDNAIEVKHIRTLTNVGPAGIYKVRVYNISPCESVKIPTAGIYKVGVYNISLCESVKIHVVPETLTFNRTNEKKTYEVTFKVKQSMPVNTNLFGRIEWYDDKKHVVGSPVAFRWTTPH